MYAFEPGCTAKGEWCNEARRWKKFGASASGGECRNPGPAIARKSRQSFLLFDDIWDFECLGRIEKEPEFEVCDMILAAFADMFLKLKINQTGNDQSVPGACFEDGCDGLFEGCFIGDIGIAGQGAADAIHRGMA